MHFGLSGTDGVGAGEVEIEVQWPSGTSEVFRVATSLNEISLIEGSGNVVSSQVK